MADAIPQEISALSFEDALKQLEMIVKDLEGGNVSLDESINAYERGAQLKRHCETKLAEARMRVEKISLDSNGKAQAVSAEIE
ncbi:exodeoxyribonuclease VII small subunit [Aestuariispira insulae]|uniref:Exodeoxyribonuclease 7 small subunit n=1 Tax=Aestuariispira insulae TaxID=1461337 RepID=A0A3D9HSM3_9PROT|nr:exodeoxyribonuclease VII small subunit [Aestuariispira insulae]RED52502.1 exodeoxyribonuclease VII small subunit [Aestuariispira insulae]